MRVKLILTLICAAIFAFGVYLDVQCGLNNVCWLFYSASVSAWISGLLTPTGDA